jgi:hypothetical protein
MHAIHTSASCRNISSVTNVSAVTLLRPVNAEKDQQINDEAATRVIMLSISPIYLRSTSDPEHRYRVGVASGSMTDAPEFNNNVVSPSMPDEIGLLGPSSAEPCGITKIGV